MDGDERRLFLGWEVYAPWPERFPYGRLLNEEHRHMTVAFLGQTNYPKIVAALAHIPSPPFAIGAAGYFDQCLLLPPKHPHVVAWHATWFDKNHPLPSFYSTLVEWLKKEEIPVDLRHGFTPHVTLARSPFRAKAWLQQFSPLPFFTKDFHLYESLGHSKYISLWNLPMLSPFEEIEHTADIAYQIRGRDFTQLFHNGASALAFTFPPLIPYISPIETIDSLEKVVMELNQIVLRADQEIGTPFKAVSYHSHLEIINDLLHWEMIVDV